MPFKIQEKAFLKSVATQEIEAAPSVVHAALTTKILQQLLIDFYDIQHDEFQTKNTSNARKKLIDTAPAKFLSSFAASPPPSSRKPAPPSNSSNNHNSSDLTSRSLRPPSSSSNNVSNNNSSGSSSPATPASKKRSSPDHSPKKGSGRARTPPPVPEPSLSHSEPLHSLIKDLEATFDQKSKA